MVVLKLATWKKTFGWQWIIWGRGKRMDWNEREKKIREDMEVILGIKNIRLL